MANEAQTSRTSERGLRLGKIAGVEVRLDVSLVVIFLLIAFTLAMGTFPQWHEDWSAPLRWGVAVIAAACFLASVLIHELSHAVVGRRLGVPVDGITLFMFGGMARMRGESESPKAELLMTIVGPLTSVAIGLAGVGVAAYLGPSTEGFDSPQAYMQKLGPAATLFAWLGPINLVLAIFNMIPGFPLDGGRVLRAGLWWATGDRRKATLWASRGGQTVGFALIALGIVQALGGGVVGGLWLVLIGWFLSASARASYVGLVRNEILGDLPVRFLARSEGTRVRPETSLGDLARGPALDGDDTTFPVYDGDRWVGMVGLEQLRRVPREERDRTPVGDAMVPAAELEGVRADDDAEHALHAMSRQGVDQLPVVRDGRVEGLIRQRDIVRWLYLESAEAAQ